MRTTYQESSTTLTNQDLDQIKKSSNDCYKAIRNEILKSPPTVFVNSISLMQYSQIYNDFKEDDDIQRFFKQVLLKNVKPAEYNKAISFLEKSFHHEGILSPVSLTTEKLFTNDRKEQFKPEGNISVRIDIQPTKKGFDIQEEISYEKIKVTGGKNIERLVDSNNRQIILSEKEGAPIFRARGILNFDFSDKKGVKFRHKNNLLEINHSGLNSFVDHRSFVQTLIDIFKNLFNLNNTKSISAPLNQAEASQFNSALTDIGKKQFLKAQANIKNGMHDLKAENISERIKTDVNRYYREGGQQNTDFEDFEEEDNTFKPL